MVYNAALQWCSMRTGGTRVYKPKYYLVDADMLPEIFLKVADAKERLQTGEAATVV